MKKIIILTAAIICTGILTIGCSTPNNYTDTYTRDKTLAGSICWDYYRMDTDGGWYDGSALQDFKLFQGYNSADISKLSDTKINFDCDTTWEIGGGEKIRFRVVIPDITVYGKPFNVTLDHTSTDAKVWHYIEYTSAEVSYIEYTPVEASVKGWMIEKYYGNTQTRTSIAAPKYDCELDIECTFGGKELKFRITGLH